MHPILAFIQRKKSQRFTGYLHFGETMVFFDNGVLCTAEAEKDRFWILRRLLCGNHITDEYAQELQDSEEELTLLLFPTVSEQEWNRVRRDRSRQNIFEILGSGLAPIEVPCFVDKLPYLQTMSLEELDTLYKDLFPFLSRLQHIWIKAQKSDSPVQAQLIPLSALVAQSPWEELDTLKSILELIHEEVLDWGENIAALEGALLEEEVSLFGDEEDSRKDVQFVVPKKFLDRVQLDHDEDV